MSVSSLRERVYLLLWITVTGGCIAAFVVTRAAWTLELGLGFWVALGFFRYGLRTMLGSFAQGGGPLRSDKYDDVPPKR